MSRKIERVDEFGFPLPHTFDDDRPAPRRLRNSRPLGWLRATLVLVGVVLLIGMIFKEPGRKFMAAWYQKQAEQNYRADDLASALDCADMALRWTPNSADLYEQRAHYRQESGDLAGSLEDYNKLLLLDSKRADAYVGRSIVLQRMGAHRRAIDDVTKAISLRSNYDHRLLNQRAYTRAIANLELDEALEDIQQAIRLAGGEMAEYIDTRGYIYYLLDRQEEALADLDRAVALIVERRQYVQEAVAARRGASRRAARWLRLLAEHEAVMTYHRGLVHEKLGNVELAQADKSRGEELGYNPANGVY
jgi:tetratricopeptide (TPR) repeat protein